MEAWDSWTLGNRGEGGGRPWEFAKDGTMNWSEGRDLRQFDSVPFWWELWIKPSLSEECLVLHVDLVHTYS